MAAPSNGSGNLVEEFEESFQVRFFCIALNLAQNRRKIKKSIYNLNKIGLF